jgi:uncharacterized cysteine cluster protein YcgN (CxxCxxCC family)
MGFMNRLIYEFKKKPQLDVGVMITDNYERKIKELEDKLDVKSHNLLELVAWLKGEKCGYLLEEHNHKTWVIYGDLTDNFPYNEDDKRFELSRNRMIDKTIKHIERLDIL